MESETNSSYKIILATSLSLFVSAMSIFLRLVCRRLKNVPLLTDDYLAVSSLIFMIAIAAASLFMTGIGLGSREANVTVGQLVTYLQLSYAIYLLYPPTVTFAKLSVLFFYRRILPVKQILISTTIMSGILITWCVVVLCTSIFRCSPSPEAWRPIVSDKCVNRDVYTLTLQIPSIAIDIGIIILPLKSVWDSVLRVPQKALATTFFMAGLLTLTGDILKLETMLRSEGFSDVTHSEVDMFVWSNLSPAFAILAASIPLLRPLIQSTKKLGSKRSSETTGILGADMERGYQVSPEPPSLQTPISSSELNLPSCPKKAYTREERVKSIFGDGEKQTPNDRNDQFFMDI